MDLRVRSKWVCNRHVRAVRNLNLDDDVSRNLPLNTDPFIPAGGLP